LRNATREGRLTVLNLSGGKTGSDLVEGSDVGGRKGNLIILPENTHKKNTPHQKTTNKTPN